MKTISEKYGITTAETAAEEIALINTALDAAYEAGDMFAVNRLEARRQSLKA